MQSNRHLIKIRRGVNSVDWWKGSYKNNWITEEELRWVVITPENPFGDITKEEFKMITDSEF